MEEKTNDEKLYFQDSPVNNYKDDYVGFEEEVNMIKEGIESDTKIIGLISEYGSGKSSIIELLKNELYEDEYDVVNINLLDPNGKIDGTEAHKRMLIQLANHKYSGEKKKLSYVIKRLNPNYKSIDISTKNNMSLCWIIVSIIFFVIKILYKNNILQSIGAFSVLKNPDLVKIIKDMCDLSGIIGFIILFITVLKSDFVYHYLKNDDIQTVNEFDLIEMSKELIAEDKTTIIIIEDLDRIENPTQIEIFIKELNAYYKSMNKCKFIIALTPEEFYRMSHDKSDKKKVDSKYKPFNMIIDLQSIKDSDYGVILNKLLLSKEAIFKKYFKFDINKNLNDWSWLSFGANMNIRRLKHRINSVLHMYKTLSNRFPEKYIELKTCIAISYLKDEYEQEYETLIKGENDKFKLKEQIEKYIKEDISPEALDGINLDLYNLIKSGYIDYNCEMYCYNYSKYNKIFDIYEYELVNALMYDRKLELEDLKVERIINNNPDCIKDILDKRLSLNMGLPLNIFDSKPLINYLYNDNKDIVKVMCKELLPIDKNHIKSTVGRINKIKGTIFFNEDNLKKYIEDVTNQLQENGNLDHVSEIRLNLLSVINNPLILKGLYDEMYEIITPEEIKIIHNLHVVTELIDYNKVNINNIPSIIEAIDEIYMEHDSKEIMKITNNLKEKYIDYYFKNCKSLSKIEDDKKELILEQNQNKLNLTNLTEIKKVINNFNYSTEYLENLAIDMINRGNGNIFEYSVFVNIIPNIHLCTLKRIEKDDFNFEVDESIIKEFYKRKEIYGYLKFKTLKENDIPVGKKIYYEQYELLYANPNHTFDECIKKNITVLKYIRDKKIYEKYDNNKLMLMTNCPQTLDLLSYAFNTFQESQELNDYIANIYEIASDDVVKEIIEQYNTKIKELDDKAYYTLIRCCKSRSLKTKLAWTRKK